MQETQKDVAGASGEYTQRRAELYEAEVALKDQRERVAALRRELPAGPVVDTDYVFREGPAALADADPAHAFDTRLSELFAEGLDHLIVIHLMYGPEMERACPMCSMWADSYNAVVRHVTQRANLVLVAKIDLETLRGWARERGWDRLRLLSSAENSFNEDFLVEQSGRQLPAVSVFSREGDGTIRHFYTTQASLEFANHRGIDLFSPVWNLFDLIPTGRGDWYPSLRYD